MDHSLVDCKVRSRWRLERKLCENGTFEFFDQTGERPSRLGSSDRCQGSTYAGRGATRQPSPERAHPILQAVYHWSACRLTRGSGWRWCSRVPELWLSMRCAHPYQAVGTLYHPLCNTTDYRVSACAARPLLGALRPPGPLLGRRNGMTVPLDAMALLVPSNSYTTC